MKEIVKEKEDKILDVPRIILDCLIIFVLIFVASFVYLSVKGNDNYTGIYSESVQKEVIKSLVTTLGLYNVHAIPYLGTTPKIQLYIKESTYFVESYYFEISNGEVMIKDGETSERDITIRTTEAEALRMANDTNYTRESWISGRTTVEKATSDFVLFTKGYPDIFIEK